MPVDRFLDLTDGVAMVVTDLHGDREAFDLMIEHFRAHHANRQAQRLILLGDLIHFYGPPAYDHSLDMMLDLLALREELGENSVIMLLGNHEMPHIYNVTLTKGAFEFTPRFEHAMGEHRARIIDFFKSLPFYIRTAAGVMLSHAGPAIDSVGHVETLRRLDHDALLAEADNTLAQADDLEPYYDQYANVTGEPYREAARRLHAINGPADPRYPHLLRGFAISQQNRQFDILWNALFTQNESGLTEEAYTNGCQVFLQTFSVDAPCPQNVIVSGHIATPSGGHTLVNRQHLRMASAAHARPREAGQYLLLDCTLPQRAAPQLLGSLRNLFD